MKPRAWRARHLWRLGALTRADYWPTRYDLAALNETDRADAMRQVSRGAGVRYFGLDISADLYREPRPFTIRPGGIMAKRPKKPAPAPVVEAHEFVVDSAEARRVKYGDEDLDHCAVCGQAADRPIHRVAETDDERRLVNGLITDIARKMQGGPPLGVELRPQTAFQLAAMIQFAARHPKFSPALRPPAEAFVRAVRNYFNDCPFVLEAIDRGCDYPNFNV